MKNSGDCIGSYRILRACSSSALYDCYVVEHMSRPGQCYLLRQWRVVRFGGSYGYNIFRARMNILINLGDPRILAPLDFGVDADNYPYVLLPQAMERMETVAERLRRAPLTENECERIFIAVGAALVLAHQRDLIHGLFSSESVLMTEQGEVCVSDFFFSGPDMSVERAALPAAYRFPEQQSSRLSDQYALAALYQELLLEQGETPEDATLLRQAIARARSRDPRQRFRSVRDFMGTVGIPLYVPADVSQECEPSLSGGSGTRSWLQQLRRGTGRLVPAPLVSAIEHVNRMVGSLALWGFLASLALLLILHMTGSDWAAGAFQASQGAMVYGFVLILILLLRWLTGFSPQPGPARVRRRVLATAYILFMFLYAYVAQALQPTLHLNQAAALEGQQQWQQAINEYRMGGELPPGSVSLARTYTSWGLALGKQQRYNEALAKLELVISTFASPYNGTQLRRAEAGVIDIRLALAHQSMQAHNYADATSAYDAILQLPYCQYNCQTPVSNLDAVAFADLGQDYVGKKDYHHAVTAFDMVLNRFPTAPAAAQVRAQDASAYYNMAQDFLRTRKFDNSIKTFDILKSRFPQSPEFAQSHGPMATALLSFGQQQRAAKCEEAIPTYQRLAKEFNDTNEGRQARHDLSAPQTITGHFTNFRHDMTFTQIALTQGLVGNMSAAAAFDKWNNAYISTDIDTNGNFTFTNVDQGTYDLMWYANTGSAIYVEYIFLKSSNQPFDTVTVGPLCPVTTSAAGI